MLMQMVTVRMEFQKKPSRAGKSLKCSLSADASTSCCSWTEIGDGLTDTNLTMAVTKHCDCDFHSLLSYK